MAGSADVQGDLWSQQPDVWARTQEAYFVPLYEAVLDRFGIRPYRQADGSYALRNQFRFVIARA